MHLEKGNVPSDDEEWHVIVAGEIAEDEGEDSSLERGDGADLAEVKRIVIPPLTFSKESLPSQRLGQIINSWMKKCFGGLPQIKN